jgi:hypothetical protein
LGVIPWCETPLSEGGARHRHVGAALAVETALAERLDRLERL